MAVTTQVHIIDSIIWMMAGTQFITSTNSLLSKKRKHENNNINWKEISRICGRIKSHRWNSHQTHTEYAKLLIYIYVHSAVRRIKRENIGLHTVLWRPFGGLEQKVFVFFSAHFVYVRCSVHAKFVIDAVFLHRICVVWMCVCEGIWSFSVCTIEIVRSAIYNCLSN